ncbi:MAG: clostripain-related cysteine peptidase [Thermoplasmata archaeon]
MKRLFALLVTGCILLSLIPVVQGEIEQREWTVMIYMAGGADEEISKQVEEDLAEIGAGEPGNRVEVLVLADQFLQGDTKLWNHEGDGLREIPLSSVNRSWTNEVNMAESQSLRDFVIWSKSSYPANRYMLYIWGHGDGWRGMPMERWDDLYLHEIQEALSGIRVDILGFDSCSMGTFELFYQLRESGDIIIASPLDIPINGLPYDTVLDRMGEKPDMNKDEVSRMMIHEFVNWSRDNTPVRTGMVAVRTSELPVQEFRNYTNILRSSIPYHHSHIELAWDDTEENLDIYDFSTHVGLNTNCGRLMYSGIRLREAVNRSVVFERGTHQEHVGLQVHSSYPVNSGYEELSFSELDWNLWIREFFESVSAVEVNMSFDVHTEENHLSVYFQHDVLDGVVEVDVHAYYEGVHKYTFNESAHEFIVEVLPGTYAVEAYLMHENLLQYHVSYPIYFERYVIMEGTVEHKSGIIVEMKNTDRDTWINRTLPKGDYVIELHQPEFCRPGDVLNITYRAGEVNETLQYTVPVEDRFTVDFTDQGTSRYMWLIYTYLIFFTILGLYVIRREGKKV